MKDETILKLIEEAKQGITTVSDFYAPEIVSFFWTDTIFGLIVSAFWFFCAVKLIKHTIKAANNKKSWATERNYSGTEWSPAAYVVTAFSGIIGFVSIVCFSFCLYFAVQLIVAPKIFITTQIIRLFSGC